MAKNKKNKDLGYLFYSEKYNIITILRIVNPNNAHFEWDWEDMIDVQMDHMDFDTHPHLLVDEWIYLGPL
jgi:hypothetical protein